MNILILTGRFGMGHYSVAQTMVQDIQKENPTRSMRRGKLLTVGSIICHQKCNFIRSSQPGLQLP